MQTEDNAVGAPVEAPVRRGFWPSFWDGLGFGPMWRWAACRLGWHRWWHLQVQKGDEFVDLCCDCGRTRPAKD